MKAFIKQPLFMLHHFCFTVFILTVSSCATVEDKEASKSLQEDSAQVTKTKPVLPPNPYLQNRVELNKNTRNKFSTALQAVRKQEWNNAEKIFLDLIQQHPELSGTYLNLGFIASEKHDFKQAEKWVKQAIDVNQYNLDAYNQLAIIYRETGRFELAEKYYRQAIAVWPGYDIAFLNLGILYELYMGRLEDALVQYQHYQNLQQESDRRVVGWIKDLRRRIKKKAGTG